MICTECGAENRAGRKYCFRCGARLAVACPACGAANLPGERYCGECGAALPAGEPTAGAGLESVAETERRFVTVLFADLVGFTPFSESRDPEQVREFLMAYFAAARETIERFGGAVEKFIGDAVMAVWGAVSAAEDDAERAVRAGLELAAVIPKLGAEMQLPSLAVRVGVLTGEAAVGPGEDKRGLVVGDLVNTAARLQSIAPPGAVVVGESTYRLTRLSIRYESLGDLELKGKQAPTPAWRATGVAGLRGGRHRGGVIEPPFVDRVEELRLLKDALHATGRERRARLVSIMGIAGIGKTRLAWEFEKYIDGITEPIYWHEGHSPAYGEGVALWALGEMVRGRAGITEGEPAPVARERLAAMLQEYVPEARDRRWMEPRLAGLLGLVEVPPGERGELFSAFRALFERVAALGTTVLVFEDLHLADEGLLDFIEEIPEWSRDHPILVIALARPEILDRRPTWGAGRHSFFSIHLGPLPDEDMLRLIQGLVPGSPPRVADLVLEAAAGVPLYAVELIRMLIDDGRLVEEDGRFRLTGDLEGLAVPETLHAVIGARLDRLDPAVRALIGDAAVLGQTFTLDALAAIRGEPAAALRDRLPELVRRELLAVRRDPDSPERGQYGFVQSPIREVTYSRLTRAERRERHLRAARFFERQGDEAAGIVAGHYLSARAAAEQTEAEELGRRASAALRAAAERAAALHSHEQALSYCLRALETAPSNEDAPALMELAAESAAALARPDEAEGYAQRLVAWHLERQERGPELAAVHLLGRILVEKHDIRRAILLLEETLSFADDEAHPVQVAQLREMLARAHMLAGNLNRAVDVADASLVVAERHGLTQVIAQNLITKGTALGDLGRMMEGVALLQGALEVAIEHELPTTELRARTNLSHLVWDDDPAGQLLNLRSAFEQARRLGNRGWAVILVGNLFDVLRATGDFDGALAVIDSLDAEGLPLAQQLSLQMIRLTVLRYRDDPAAVRAEVNRLAEWEKNESPDPQAPYYALVFQAAAAGIDGDHEAAYRFAREAGAANPMGSGDWLIPAGTAAMWLRDRRRLEEVLADLDARQPLGRTNAAWRLEVEAALAALNGDGPRALALFQAARKGWEDLGLTLHLANGLTHFVLFCSGTPEAAAAEAEARRLYGQMGAPNLLALLEQAKGVSVPT